jgi:molybdenum cofactor cytidylyltransferase
VLGVVVLAAGRSTRMGRPKMLLPWGNTTVLGHLIREWTELGATRLAVVCACADNLMAAELDRQHFPESGRIYNTAPDRGMFSSIQCAATWSGWVSAVTHWALVLGDQPHIARSTLRTLLDFTARNAACVCQPARAGKARHPVVLPRAVFSAIPASTAENLREFLSPWQPALCEIDDSGLDLDIDLPEDYERALKLSAQATR